MGWAVRGSNPGGGDIFRTRPDRPWGPPSLLHNRYQVSFPGVEWLGCGVDHLPHLAQSLKKEKSHTLLPLWAFVVCSRVTFTFTFTLHIFSSVLVSDFISYSFVYTSQNHQVHLLSSVQDSAHCFRCQNRHTTQLKFFLPFLFPNFHSHEYVRAFPTKYDFICVYWH
jgi:hypothetical protein